MVLTVEIGEVSCVANEAAHASRESVSRSLVLRRITEGIREEMMVAMLDLMQGAASACADICTQRLRTLHDEMMQSKQFCHPAKLECESSSSTSADDKVMRTADWNNGRLQDQRACDPEVSLNAMYEDWGAVIQETRREHEPQTVSASEHRLECQGTQSPRDIVCPDSTAWFDAEALLVVSPILRGSLDEQLQEVADEVCKVLQDGANGPNAGCKSPRDTSHTSSEGGTGEVSCGPLLGKAVTAATCSGVRDAKCTTHVASSGTSSANDCLGKLCANQRRMSYEARSTLLSGPTAVQEESVGSATDSDAVSARGQAGGRCSRACVATDRSASSGRWEGNLRLDLPCTARSTRCWRPELTRPSSPRLRTQHRSRRTSRSADASRPSDDEREPSVGPRSPRTARGERASARRPPAAQSPAPRRFPVRLGRAESFTSARSRSQSAASSDGGRSESAPERVTPVHHITPQGVCQSVRMNECMGADICPNGSEGAQRKTVLSAPSALPIQSLPTPARSVQARPAKGDSGSNAASHCEGGASSLECRAGSCESLALNCAESKAESRAELARRQALARLKCAQQSEKVKLCVFKTAAAQSHKSS